jgi:hypothetical protein
VDPAVHFLIPNLDTLCTGFLWDDKKKEQVAGREINPALFHYLPEPRSLVGPPGLLAGGIVTRGDYERFVLHAEFKWGTAGQRDKARRAFLAVHCGEAGPGEKWPPGYACLLNEGEMGALQVVGRGGRKFEAIAKFKETGTGGNLRREYDPEAFGGPVPPRGVVFRMPGAKENDNDWNTVVLTCSGDTVAVRLNDGKEVVNELKGLSQKRGKVVIAAEHGGITFRRLFLRPLDK